AFRDYRLTIPFDVEGLEKFVDFDIDSPARMSAAIKRLQEDMKGYRSEHQQAYEAEQKRIFTADELARKLEKLEDLQTPKIGVGQAVTLTPEERAVATGTPQTWANTKLVESFNRFRLELAGVAAAGTTTEASLSALEHTSSEMSKNAFDGFFMGKF